MSHEAPNTPLSESGFASWHALHMEALDRLEAMERALNTRDWEGVDAGSRWIFEVLRPHNEGEESDLFPRLDRCGAGDLAHQLYLAHREMWDLNLKILTGIDEGRTRDPEGLAALAARLVAMIRRHIELEETRMLPLLVARAGD